MNENKALDAPLEIEIGGKKFKFAKLTTKDWAQFHEWARREYLRKTYGAVADLLSPKEKVLLLKELQTEDLGNIINNALSDPKGVAYLMFLAARRCDESITFEKFQDSLPDNYMEDLIKGLEKISPFSEERKEKEKDRSGKSQTGR